MNDFTKDELESILCALEYIGESPSWRSVEDWDDEIKAKIQSMIDNYCEHDWGVGFGSIYSPIVYCKRCHCQKPMVPTDIFNRILEVNL